MSNITRDSMNFRDFPSIMDERFLGTFQHQQNFLATQTLRAGSNGSDYHLSAEGSIIGEEDYSRIDQDLQQNAKWYQPTTFCLSSAEEDQSGELKQYSCFNELLLELNHRIHTNSIDSRYYSSNNFSEQRDELTHKIKENSYFVALVELFEEEKYKFGVQMEKYDLWSDIQAALELEPKNSQSKIARIMGFCFNEADKQIETCQHFPQSKGTEKMSSLRDSLAESRQIRSEMNSCYRDYSSVADHLQRNAHLFEQEANRILDGQSSLRPIGSHDCFMLVKCLKSKIRRWQEEVQTMTCNRLLFLKSRLIGKQKRRNFTPEVIHILNNYFMSNIRGPYPDEATKLELAERCGITFAQVSNWFGNKRIRYRKHYFTNKHPKEIGERDYL